MKGGLAGLEERFAPVKWFSPQLKRSTAFEERPGGLEARDKG